MKFREDSSNGFQITERAGFCYKQTDRQAPGVKQYVSLPYAGGDIKTPVCFTVQPYWSTDQKSFHLDTTRSLFWKAVNSKREEFAPKFFPFRVDPFSEVFKNTLQSCRPWNCINSPQAIDCFGLNVAFNNLSVISRRCLDETGSSMLTFRVLPHWNIMPQTLWHISPPSHIILTLSWPVPIPSSTFLMLSAKRKSS